MESLRFLWLFGSHVLFLSYLNELVLLFSENINCAYINQFVNFQISEKKVYVFKIVINYGVGKIGNEEIEQKEGEIRRGSRSISCVLSTVLKSISDIEKIVKEHPLSIMLWINKWYLLFARLINSTYPVMILGLVTEKKPE